MFDIETYDVDGVRMLESYSDYLTITANTLVTKNIIVYGNTGKKSILDISFNTIQALPSGGPQYKASDKQGRIELAFTMNADWGADLGTGLANGEYLTCKAISGIVGSKIKNKIIIRKLSNLIVNGNEITCQLMVATIPRITIKNFQSISANTPVRLQVLYVVPVIDFMHEVKLSVISLKNRVCSNLNEANLLFRTVAGTFGTATESHDIAYTSSEVNTNFDVTFRPNVAITSGSYILVVLPSYDTKFIQLNAIITCSYQTAASNPSISLPCIPYYGVDWILIQASTNVLATDTLKITNLYWPRYVAVLTNIFCFRTAIFSGTTYQYTNLAGTCFASPTSPIPNPIPNSFNLAMISVPKKGLGYVDCSYTFTFNTYNKIPANSQIFITFPSSYALIDSSPIPAFTAPLLTGYNGNPLQFSITTNQVIISNVDEISANSLFTIIGTGIQNPSSGTISSGWKIEIYFSDNLVNSLDNFFSFPYGSAFETGYVIINQISAFPINADEYADYTIVFTPQTDIPANGLISVTFPSSQFKELPGALECMLTGGMQTFTSCILSSTTVKIITGEKYSSGVGSIYLKIKHVKNPDEGTTDGFLVTTSYDGVTLDVTDATSLSGRTFTSIAKAGKKIYFK